MNILGIVFSLILILSYTFYACWDKQKVSSQLRTTYIKHEKANRKIFNQYQSQIYSNFGYSPSVKEQKEEPQRQTERQTPRAEPTEKEPELNHECARLNLWPLIQEGRQAQPMLYELAAKLIRTFYSNLGIKKKRFEYYFLDVFLPAAKLALQEQNPLALEKIDLQDPEMQKIYYKMLKGTKNWDLVRKVGCPPLLDYIKMHPAHEKICLCHAHPDMLTTLFNPRIAAHLHSEIHKKDKPLLTRELVERIASEEHEINLDPDLLDLLEFGYPHHHDHKKIFTAQEGEVFLRKNIQI